MINKIPSKSHLLPFTVFAILTDKISVMPVYAIQEANVPSNTYAKAVSALELNPSITQLIMLTSSPELTTGKPPIRPATVRDTSMESNTLIFSRHNTQSKITATITGFSIELPPSFRNI